MSLPHWPERCGAVDPVKGSNPCVRAEGHTASTVLAERAHQWHTGPRDCFTHFWGEGAAEAAEDLRQREDAERRERAARPTPMEEFEAEAAANRARDALLEAATAFDFDDVGDCYKRYDCIIDGKPLGEVWEARHQERGVAVVRTRDEALAFLGVKSGTWTALMRG